MTDTTGRPRRSSLLLIGIGVCLAVSACGGSDPKAITKSTFQGDWPLTVTEATVTCGKQNKQSVGVSVNGTTYALNGTAKTWEKWPGLEPVWAAGDYPGIKVNVGDLITYAQTVCK